MSRNLANIYALLTERYGETYTLTYEAKKPTYLEKILGIDQDAGNNVEAKISENKVIFVRLEDRIGYKSTNAVSTTPLNIKAEPTDLNLTGSPLKDDSATEISEISSSHLKIDSIALWKPEEEFQKGLSVEKAREIICSESLQIQPMASGSVWILCDTLDDIEKTLLLQYEFSNNNFSRGTVRFAGFVPVNSLNSQIMLESHGAGHNVETLIENVYKMESDILVRCTWSTLSPKPALIDFKSCDITLSHIFRLNDCGSLTQDFINQLRMLICIRNDIIAYNEGENSAKIEPVYQCGCGIDMEEMRESINTIVTEFGCLGDPESNNELEYGFETVVRLAKSRRTNDLTSNLWDVLKRCSSYKDLKTAMHMLFQCAARCGILNMPTKTRLAEIITEVSNHRLAIPCLTGAEPLELLLEIGLEKLYKDYEYIFTESKICSPNSLKKTNEETNSKNATMQSNYRKSLSNAVKNEIATARKTLLHNVSSTGGGAHKPLPENINWFKNTNFDGCATGMKLAKLLQIHCTLEHLLALHINLKLQSAFSDICEQLLSRPLSSCDNLDESYFDQMDISIAAHSNVRDYLDGKDPYSRRITFNSCNKFRQHRTTFFYSMENVCPPCASAGFDSEEFKTGKENVYYSWVYQKIQTAK